MNKCSVRTLRFLLCDITGNVGELSSPDEEWASSPIQCLDKAIDGNPSIIVIRFCKIPIREREALVELSNALKRNIHTQKCPVLALLHSKQRKLIEDLKQAKVDYLRYIDDTNWIQSGCGRSSTDWGRMIRWKNIWQFYVLF